MDTVHDIATSTVLPAATQAATESKIHIALAAEQLGTLFGIPVTNTLLMGGIVFIILTVFSLLFRRSLKLIPGRLQTLIEILFTGILDYMTDALEDEKLARKIFPLILTIFLFIFTANIIEFTPGVGSAGFFHQNGLSAATGAAQAGEFTPLLRSLNTDLNTTLALTIIVFIVIEVMGVTVLGALKYGKKFVNLSSALGFLVGFMEFFSELARLISFSFRLFGNIFAGEVLILVMQFFAPYVVPVPFMAFEVFVGFMQAAIFALLTLFFIKIAVAETAH